MIRCHGAKFESGGNKVLGPEQKKWEPIREGATGNRLVQKKSAFESVLSWVQARLHDFSFKSIDLDIAINGPSKHLKSHSGPRVSSAQRIGFFNVGLGIGQNTG